jgi:hypothetical protein
MNAAMLIKDNDTPRIGVAADYIYQDKIKPHAIRWDPVRRMWILPYDTETWQNLVMSIPNLTPRRENANDLSRRDRYR